MWRLMISNQAACSTRSSLGQSHVSAYRRSLAVSSTTISYSCQCDHLGGVSEIQTSLNVSDLKKVIKGHEEWISSSSLMHRYPFPLLDVLYRQVGSLSFWTVRCTEFRHGRHQGARNTMTSAWDSELIYLSDLTYRRKYASFAHRQLVKRCLIGRSWDARHARYLAI